VYPKPAHTMRFLFPLIAIALGKSALSGTTAEVPTEFVVIVSSRSAPAALDITSRHFFELLLRDAPMGAHVAVWDGYYLTRIGEADIPQLQHDNSDSRAECLAPVLVGLKRWREQARKASRDEGSAADDTVRLPEVLAELGPVEAGRQRRILIVASPFYLCPHEPTFSMNESRYPSDAHLGATLAESPYGTAGREQALCRTALYWAYGADSQWGSGAHRIAVERWWHLWMAAQGGALTTFSPDAAVAWSRFVGRNVMGTVVSYQRDTGDSRIEMRSAQPRRVPDWLANAAAPAMPPPEPPSPAVAGKVDMAPSVPGAVALPVISPAQERLAPLPRVQDAPVVRVPLQLEAWKTGIGIAWSAKGVDLDLYVRPHSRAQEIYYRRDRTKEGFLYRDMRNANTGGLYEFVEFSGPVDLSQISVWINYYAGSAANVSGQVVLFDRGVIKVGNFTLGAGRGNRGNDKLERASSPYWTEVRLVDLQPGSGPLVANKPGTHQTP